MASSSGAVPDFSDLLQSAEQLTAEFESSFLPASLSRGASGHGPVQGGLGMMSSTASSGTASDGLPRIERNLAQLVEAGQQLFNKTSKDSGTDVKAALLLGAKGVDLPAIDQQLAALGAAASQVATRAGPISHLDSARDTDIAGFLRSERENAILAVIEETRKETFDFVDRLHWDAMATEWEADKKRILNALNVTNTPVGDLLSVTSTLRPEASIIHESMLGRGRSMLDHYEIMYAKEVEQHNSAAATGFTIKADLVEKFSSLFPPDRDNEVASIWEVVRAMADLQPPPGSSAKWRASPSTAKALINKARSFLEASFVKFVRSTVFSNLKQAQLGGIPGTFHLVKSFLNVKIPPNTPGLEDGCLDGGAPVWAMIYYCLRCGDLAAAVQAASDAGPGLAEMVKQLSETASSPDKRLTPHSESIVRLAYRRSIRTTTDPFKRAVYCLLGACDPSDEHAEIANTIEDYLWLKLIQLRLEDSAALDSSMLQQHTEHSTMTLAQLQTLMSEEYGESHFNAYEQPTLYFSVLFLTGQFEAGIEFLFRLERLRSHAIHVALALFDSGLLLLPNNVQAALLSKDAADRAPIKRLNVARMIMLYVKKFESTDPKEAINYLFFLKSMKGTKNENLFTASISQLVLESKEYDLLLGYLAPDGSRVPGLLDRLHNSPLETQKVVEAVAEDSEMKGIFEDSVKLFDLAKKHDRVIELLNKLLAQVITQPSVPESRRDRLQRQAVDVARRYRAMGHSASKDNTETFYLLLDIMTFFDLFHVKKYEEALDTIAKLRIVPLCQSDVDGMVSTFRVLQEEVRRNIPDVLLATMNALFAQYKQTKGATPGRGADGGRQRHLEGLRDKARALITYAGMIPYRMPGDANARLVQMEVLMN